MSRSRRGWIGAIVIGLVVLSVSACADAGVLTGEGLIAAQKSITVSDQGFNPNTLTIPAGDTLTFQWFGQNTNLHQVIVTGLPSGTVTSANQRTGSFQIVFPVGGTFNVSDSDNSGFSATVAVIQ
ncbi:MAG: hypothetical protein M3R65_10315 [Gemmatimonadota bacterium]|nr:hypothetical protein [Gemmatimonadota bacterium]